MLFCAIIAELLHTPIVGRRIGRCFGRAEVRATMARDADLAAMVVVDPTVCPPILDIGKAGPLEDHLRPARGPMVRGPRTFCTILLGKVRVR